MNFTMNSTRNAIPIKIHTKHVLINEAVNSYDLGKHTVIQVMEERRRDQRKDGEKFLYLLTHSSVVSLSRPKGLDRFRARALNDTEQALAALRILNRTPTNHDSPPHLPEICE